MKRGIVGIPELSIEAYCFRQEAIMKHANAYRLYPSLLLSLGIQDVAAVKNSR